MEPIIVYNTAKRAMRNFELKVGADDNEYGRTILVRARSSLEAGLIVTRERLIPDGMVAHSLVDPAARN